MERVDRLRREFSSSQTSKLGWRISLTFFCLASAILVVTLAATRLHSIDLSSVLLGDCPGHILRLPLLLFQVFAAASRTAAGNS